MPPRQQRQRQALKLPPERRSGTDITADIPPKPSRQNCYTICVFPPCLNASAHLSFASLTNLLSSLDGNVVYNILRVDGLSPPLQFNHGRSVCAKRAVLLSVSSRKDEPCKEAPVSFSLFFLALISNRPPE